jgi:hypothetical protein
MRQLLLMVFMGLFLGCKKDPRQATPVYYVPAEFEPLVSRFVQEAAQRGRPLSITNLIIKYDSTVSAAYCAVCNTLSADPAVQKIISVNPKVQCYRNAKEQEVLFFHELGHCVLNRPHNNQSMPNGDPKSIMVEGKLDLYSPCRYPIGGACPDNSFKRDYYLDELFDESTPVPSWAR